MKVLHLNTFDVEGGASRGVYWLHTELRRVGVDSHLFVGNKSSDDSTVTSYKGVFDSAFFRMRRGIEHYLPSLYKKRRSGPFSPVSFPTNIGSYIDKLNPDVVNFHWVQAGFIHPLDLARVKKPIVWTLRDMWPFTGGCHYSEGCELYASTCRSCPHLGTTSAWDMSYAVWKMKQRSWYRSQFTLVAISHWLADCARKSSLLGDQRIEVIHNAVDINKFRPHDKNLARRLFGIDPSKRVILFGALNAIRDERKGYHELVAALQHLAQTSNLSSDTDVVIFGASRPKNEPQYGFRLHYLGRLYDDVTISLAYSAADVTVVPSLEEAFGKTAIESMACGTPVVCFDATGLAEIVEHRQSGYKAKAFEPEDLARGIEWALSYPDPQSLTFQARERVVNHFSLKFQVERYRDLYDELLASSI